MHEMHDGALPFFLLGACPKFTTNVCDNAISISPPTSSQLCINRYAGTQQKLQVVTNAYISAGDRFVQPVGSMHDTSGAANVVADDNFLRRMRHLPKKFAPMMGLIRDRDIGGLLP